MDEFGGHACAAEAADQHRSSVVDVRDRGLGGIDELVDHGETPIGPGAVPRPVRVQFTVIAACLMISA
ncbi:hypothetical protein G6F21_014735 [Rhizopus arrhizus]|nr:hypothetical protein G6F21_014735 [Rhizopus arrhizus]